MIIFDTETTGLSLPGVADLSQQPRIIDFAAVKLSRMGKGKVWRQTRIQHLINPGVPISPEITKITGYTDHDLRDAPPFAAVLRDIAHFFLGERVMLAHNLPFDKSLLEFELRRLDLVTNFPWPPVQACTVSLYTEAFGRRPKLTELYERRLGKPLRQLHKAMADVEALLEIVLKDELHLKL